MKKSIILIAVSVFVSSCGSGGKEFKLNNGGIFTVKKENVICDPTYINERSSRWGDNQYTTFCTASGTVKMLNGDTINYTTPKEMCVYTPNGKSPIYEFLPNLDNLPCYAASAHKIVPEIIK